MKTTILTYSGLLWEAQKWSNRELENYDLGAIGLALGGPTVFKTSPGELEHYDLGAFGLSLGSLKVCFVLFSPEGGLKVFSTSPGEL